MSFCGICKEIVDDLKNFEDNIGNPPVPIYKLIRKCTRGSNCKYVEDGVCYSCVEDLVNYHEAVFVAKHFKKKLLKLIEKIKVVPVFTDYSEARENKMNENDASIEIHTVKEIELMKYKNGIADSNIRTMDDDDTNLYEADDTEDEKDEIVSSNECNECGEILADRLCCKLHKEKCHGSNYVCELCGKILKTKHSLQRHKISHGSEKPYSCNICSMQFHFKDRLNDHITKHSGAKPFKCKICEKYYPHKKSLNSHMMIHKKARLKHKCNVCSRVFRNPSLLKYHESIHSAVKSHFCKYCNRGFHIKYYLTQHLKENKKCYQAFHADCKMCN